jgi:hypothetical protein
VVNGDLVSPELLDVRAELVIDQGVRQRGANGREVDIDATLSRLIDGFPAGRPAGLAAPPSEPGVRRASPVRASPGRSCRADAGIGLTSANRVEDHPACGWGRASPGSPLQAVDVAGASDRR